MFPMDQLDNITGPDARQIWALTYLLLGTTNRHKSLLHTIISGHD